MGEIKFDVTRMTEVSNRITEMKERLQSDINKIKESYGQISSNITGSEVQSVITGFVNSCDTTCSAVLTVLAQNQEFINQQISKYQSTEQAGAETLTEVQNILNGLEG